MGIAKNTPSFPALISLLILWRNGGIIKQMNTKLLVSREKFEESLIGVFNAINERKITEVRRNLEKLTPVGPEDNTLEGSVNELYKN